MITYSEGQKAGLKAFLKNKYWKRKFENAPSENAKLYYAEQFSYSKGLSEGDEHTKIVIGIFKTLSAGDWDYIIANCHNNMGKWGLCMCREKYGASGVAGT